MDLFRSLADAGKTVVCITHSLANVERTCHLVVILTPGGKLAFVGTPAEALATSASTGWATSTSGSPSGPPTEWQAAFRASPLPRPLRRRPAARRRRRRRAPAFAAPQARLADGSRQFARQTALLTRRYLRDLAGRPCARCWPMAGQSLLVAVLLVLLFGDLGRR